MEQSDPLRIPHGLKLAFLISFSFFCTFPSSSFSRGLSPVEEIPPAVRQSIDSLECVTLGGIEQWVHIRGRDVTNPVLLFLHGGPGMPIIPFRSDFDATAKLEEHFVIVYWDQRGAGKSFDSRIPAESMTIAQFVADTHQLVEILRRRFQASKIYLVGHSWGSIIGALTVARYPDLFYAYVGVGQAVYMRENEELSYHFALEKAAQSGNRQALQQLTAIGPPPYADYKEMLMERQWVGKFGGGRTDKKGRFLPLTVIKNSSSDADTTPDTLAWLQGPSFSIKCLWKELQEVNLFRQAPLLAAPVYFFAGRHDYYAPSAIVERYYQQLQAPKGKTFLWFDHSAHAPSCEEPEKFYDLLVHRVLKETYH